jgi:hypothetical protein
MVEILSEVDFNKVTPLLEECLKILNGLIKRYESDELI